MSKEFEFASLSSIVDDFKKAYEDIDHKVIRIRVGLPVEHNIASFNFVCWRYLSLDPSSTPWDQCSEALERHIKISKRLWIRWLLDGQRENKRADMFLSETDTKLDALETSENKSKRRHSGQSSAALVKAAKREKELEKPGPDMKYFEERQVLTDRPSIKKLRNRPPLTEVNIGVSCKYKIAPALPLKSPRTSRASSRRCLHCQKLRSEMQSVATPVEAHHKNIKKIALKCYSLELVPGSSTINEQLSLLNRQQRPRLHRDLVRNDLRKIKKNLRKSRSATPAESPPNSMNKRKNTFTRRADFR
ncbi:hypothetical protein KP509_02G011200 [Ceratopteris richardii]|nr:hypothetical protein KP509_02G011200 [Ceratopteris richardii]